MATRCHARRTRTDRCEFDAGHDGNHGLTLTWTEEQAWDPDTDHVTVLPPLSVVPTPDAQIIPLQPHQTPPPAPEVQAAVQWIDPNDHSKGWVNPPIPRVPGTPAQDVDWGGVCECGHRSDKHGMSGCTGFDSAMDDTCSCMKFVAG